MTNSPISDDLKSLLRWGSTSQITPVCSTHSPNRVTATKRIISRTMFVPDDLKVYFLLAKKLNTNAILVENIFAVVAIRPIDLSINSNPKSSTVLITPIRPKRISWDLFFMVRFVIFLDKIQRSALGFIKYSTNVLTDDA